MSENCVLHPKHIFDENAELNLLVVLKKMDVIFIDGPTSDYDDVPNEYVHFDCFCLK